MKALGKMRNPHRVHELLQGLFQWICKWQRIQRLGGGPSLAGDRGEGWTKRDCPLASVNWQLGWSRERGGRGGRALNPITKIPEGPEGSVRFSS